MDTFSKGYLESKEDFRSFEENNHSLNSDSTRNEPSLNENVIPPCFTIFQGSHDRNLECEEKTVAEVSSDCGYASSSEEEKTNELASILEVSTTLSNETVADYNQVMKVITEKYHFDNVPIELKKLILGANEGLPNDYSVPIDIKPDWLDMKKYRLGQEFARKYFTGVNASEMMALFVLFALPDGLETLIFSKNSSTPFTAFRRYLSTVLRISSWYDHDIWSKDNPGYQNIKTVRAMHLNISKKINSTSFENLKERVTLAGSSSEPPIWKTGLKDIIQEDFRSECPFKIRKPIHNTMPGKIFVNQLDMSTTQFGFVGLMVAYPEKFGAAGATKDELEGFIHLWRSIGYLLGVEDNYNFCAGTYDEVVQRCRSFVENWAKPNFQHLTEDWEHMSRCLVEGMSYISSSGGSFEVSMMYMCWVLDTPAPRLRTSLTWSQRCEFNMVKFMMTYAVRFPGVLPMLNWFIRRALAKASSMPSEELSKLENKEYDYQVTKSAENTEIKKKKLTKGGMSQIPLLTFNGFLRLLL